MLPLSNLGRCTGRFDLAERPLIAMKCYFDGSEGADDAGDKHLTLGGFMANDAFWGSFEAEWREMLRCRYPIAPYLHMTELMSDDDPFERVNGWTIAKQDQLIEDALTLLDRQDKTKFRAIVCTINASARERLCANGAVLGLPDVICAQTTFGAAHDWYLDAHPNSLETGFAFYDRNEKFFPHIKSIWTRERTPPREVLLKRKVYENPFWDLFENMVEVDMEYHPGIQAADMLAWAHTRALSKQDRRYRHLAEKIRLRTPFTVLPLTEDVLRDKATSKVAAEGQ